MHILIKLFHPIFDLHFLWVSLPKKACFIQVFASSNLLQFQQLIINNQSNLKKKCMLREVCIDLEIFFNYFLGILPFINILLTCELSADLMAATIYNPLITMKAAYTHLIDLETC